LHATFQPLDPSTVSASLLQEAQSLLHPVAIRIIRDLNLFLATLCPHIVSIHGNDRRQWHCGTGGGVTPNHRERIIISDWSR